MKKDKVQSQIDRLYRSAFKEGDLVVLEDDVGNYYWGKLKTDELGIWLIRPGRSKFFYWDDVLFMAHDGFPVQRIKNMSQVEAERLSKMTPTKAIRDYLENIPQTTNRMVMGGGCPFSFEFDAAILLNRGQVGNWGEDTEEVGILTAKDGATCHVSYLEHHFLEW